VTVVEQIPFIPDEPDHGAEFAAQAEFKGRREGEPRQKKPGTGRESVSVLETAAALVMTAMQCAFLAGDEYRADRLGALVNVLEHEAAYGRMLEIGYSQVRRRRGRPGLTIGWYMRCDARIRAFRRARGLGLPDESRHGREAQ
jgi:hypothetical protein